MKRLLLSLFSLLVHYHIYSQELHICTVASHQTKGLDQLLHSCEYRAVSIDILGLNQPFLGLSHKLIYVQEYVKNLPKDDIVLYVDAYDVLILASKEDIVSTFLDMQAPFVISVERFCWPHPDLEPKFPRGPTSFRYINSGSFIGYAET